MKRFTPHVLATITGLTLLSLGGIAQAQNSKNEGYLVDSRSEVVRSGTGLCWHLNSWTPALAVEGCDPVVRPLALAPVAPRAAAAKAPEPLPPTAMSPMTQPALIAQSPPPKPMAKRFTFSGDALFAFDKSELRPESISMLDDFVRQIQGASYDQIDVIGHADRLGSKAYNQSLSERRAQAVKDYLVSRNVQANRIEASGVGESEPSTETADCTGQKSKALIACLQPDRRVDVDMKGIEATADSR